MEQILQATVHNFCLWGAKERLLPIRWWTAAAAAFWVVRELRSARYIIMFSGNRKSRLLTYENSPMGYCAFNLYRKDFCSYISLPNYVFRKLLKQCHIISQNKKHVLHYVVLACWKSSEHLKCSCFQGLRVDKPKCHTTDQIYSYFEAHW